MIRRLLTVIALSVSLMVNHMRYLCLTAILLAAALALATPAAADLTAAEKVDIKHLVNSSRNLRDGERYLIEAINIAGTATSSWPSLHSAMYSLYLAQIEHTEAYAALLHTGINGNVPVDVRPDMTSAEWRAKADFHLERYRWRLGDAAAAVKIAKTFHLASVAYQSYLAGMLNHWLPTASYYADAVNEGLPYTDPWPVLLPGKTVHTIVGPHGDYRHMQWFLNRGKVYAQNTYGALLSGYSTGAIPGHIIRAAWIDSSNLLDTLDRATALLADVTFTAEEANEDRFCRVLRVDKLLTVNAAQRYQAWSYTIGGMFPEPQRTIVRKLGDSWKHAVDLSTWQSLVFPESTRCAAPFLKD